MSPLDPIPLASDPNWLDPWRNGNWLEGAIRPFIWRLGRPAFILLLGAPFSLGLWIQTESMILPAVFLTLFMGLILGGAPPEATLVGYILVVAATLIAYRSISGVGKG